MPAEVGGGPDEAAEAGAVPAAVERWRQFTPLHIMVGVGRCMARTWRGEDERYGGQCRRRCVPGSEFCGSHIKSLPFGRVDGDIPEPKFREFLKYT